MWNALRLSVVRGSFREPQFDLSGRSTWNPRIVWAQAVEPSNDRLELYTWNAKSVGPFLHPTGVCQGSTWTLWRAYMWDLEGGRCPSVICASIVHSWLINLCSASTWNPQRDWGPSVDRQHSVHNESPDDCQHYMWIPWHAYMWNLGINQRTWSRIGSSESVGSRLLGKQEFRSTSLRETLIVKKRFAMNVRTQSLALIFSAR
jgi:hypothetical protein